MILEQNRECGKSSVTETRGKRTSKEVGRCI